MADPRHCEPRDVEPGVQSFVPFPMAELREAYDQRLRYCVNTDGWSVPLEP